MKRSNTRPALASLLAGCLAVAATAPVLSWQEAATEAAPAAIPSDLAVPDGPVRLGRVDGYAVLDRQHVVLRSGVSRHYLVTLERPCFGLRTGFSLGLSVRSYTTIHTPHFEFVQTEDGRCFFDSIEVVESNDAARALIAARAEAAEAAEMDGSASP
ncbi:DUF6491 family protein [Maricaulis sp.]|uniref:DUF6491 family protein n=1 Tax=Maricaulis sp. TaxID=1486257 RepID=UPI003A8C8B07